MSNNAEKSVTDLKQIRTDKDLIAFGNTFFRRSAQFKKATERQWRKNIAFVAGDQLIQINRATNKIVRLETELDPDWMIRTVDNRILPIYRTLCAKLTKSKPLPTAIAHTGQEADVNAARGARKLLENHWHTRNMEEKHQEIVSYLITTGNCFTKQFWNPNLGRMIDEQELEDSSPRWTGDGFEVASNKLIKTIHEGDTDIVVRSPFNFYPQPGRKALEKMSMVGDAEIMGVAEIYDIYGKEVAPEKDAIVSLAEDIELSIESGTLFEQSYSDSAVVKELYILPCKQFPSGMVACWAGSTILYIKENLRKLPFTHFKMINIPGRFWAKGIIEDIVPLQVRWNELLSKIEMHNDLYNDPPMLYDPAVVDADDWTAEPGLLISVEGLANYPGKPVYPLAVPELESAIFKELDILDQQFELVPIINKVSFGKDTINAASGRAINFLQEKDDDIIRPLSDQIEIAYKNVFLNDFELCRENYEEDRGFAVVGENNKIEWIDFTVADLHSGIDISVEPGSAMPRSTAAKQAMVLDMLREGFFDDPNTGKRDFVKALRYMEFGSVEQVYEDAALDSAQAKREHNKLKKEGFMPQPEMWHNHFAHLTEHNRLRKTVEYEEEFSDEMKIIMEEHVRIHEEMLAAANAPMMPPMPPGGGMPPEGMPPGVPMSPSAPTQEDVGAFLQILSQARPDVIEELERLPEREREAAIMQLMAEGPPAEELA